MRKFGCVILCILVVVFSCKKEEPKKSSEKQILSFDLLKQKNSQLQRDIYGRISNDSVIFSLKVGENISGVIPTITIKGVSLSPNANNSQDFSKSIPYTVTADDGSTRSYKTVIYNLSTEKKITSFVLKSQNNSSLTTDFTGTIVGDSSIYLSVPSNTDLTNLIPTINYTGAGIFPGNQLSVNFSNGVKYIVSAEDGTSKIYSVYIGSLTDVFANSNDGFLYDINPISGEVKWKYNVGGTGNCVYNNSTVYFFEDNNTTYSGYLANITAINSIDGTVKWKVNLANKGYDGHKISMPVIKNDKLYFGFTGKYYMGSVTTGATCIDMNSGSVLWQKYDYFPTNWGNVGANYITIENNVFCLYTYYYGILLLNALDGSYIADYRGELGNTNPILQNGILYYGLENGLIAKNISTNKNLWWLTGDYIRTPTILGSSIYYPSAIVDSLYSVNVSNGTINWRKRNNHSTLKYYSAVASNGKLFTLDEGRFLNSINATDGSVNWSVSSYITNPVVCNNSVFSSDANSILTCLDAQNGSIKWKFNSSIKFTQPVVVVNNNNQAYYISESGMQN